MKDKILIIIPAYNEEDCILTTYNSIVEYNRRMNKNYDVLVINDGSKDNTATILDDNHIKHIDLILNLGIGGAVQTGYKFAFENDYDVAVQFDGDGQHDIAYVEAITSPIINGDCDFVIGSRFVDITLSDFKSSASRRMGINIISYFIKLVTKVKVLDTTSGFRAVNRSIIKEFAKSYPSEYPEPITTTELLKRNYVMKEVPVKMHERNGGESSIRAWKTVYYMINVILTIIFVRGKKY